MTKLSDDIQEIKSDVKEMRGMLHEALTRQAVLEARLNSVSGKVNAVIAMGLSIVTGLAYAAWDYIKAKML